MSLTVITGRHTSLIATNTMSAICPNLLAWLFSNERFAEALASLSGVFPSSSWDSAFAVAYHPGFACNLTCSYCYQKHESLKEQKGIWKPTIHKKDICDKREIANFIFAEMNRARMKQIDLSLLGGEPLMYLDDIGDFVKELRALMQIRSVSVITNGTLISPNSLQILDKIGCNEVQITFDGNSYFHNKFRKNRSGRGTYRQVMNACKLVVGSEIKLNIRINVTSQNLRSIDELIIDLSRTMIGKHARINLALIDDTDSYHDSNWEKGELIRQIYHIYKLLAENELHASTKFMRMHCGTCGDPFERAGLVVASDGKLYSCWDTAGDISQAVGDVRKGYNPKLFDSNWKHCGYRGSKAISWFNDIEAAATRGLLDGAWNVNHSRRG